MGRKFIIFALFYFVFESKFQVQSPRGFPRRAYTQRDDLTEGFLRYDFGGLIHGGAYFWNFTVDHSTVGILLLPILSEGQRDLI